MNAEVVELELIETPIRAKFELDETVIVGEIAVASFISSADDLA
jgi:hypothetical protein